MRFKTTITNVSLLHKIIKSLAALAKLCVIKISPDTIHFIIAANEGQKEGVQVWSQIKNETLFSDLRLESNSNNEIFLEVNLEALLKILKSAETMACGPSEHTRSAAMYSDAEVTLKLVKKGRDAAWAFDVRPKGDHGIAVSHEINVQLLTHKRQRELEEPLCPPPDIHIVLPKLSDLRNIVSRLSRISDEVTFSANHEGTMELSVRSPKVNLSTVWKGQSIPSSSGELRKETHSSSSAYPPCLADEEEAEVPPDIDHFFKTTVPVRGLQKFLSSHLVAGTSIACICENHCVIAYVYIGEINEAGGVLTFFIPAKNA